jgi:glucokinase
MKEVTYGNRIPSIKNGTLAVDIGGTNTNFGIFHKKKLLLSLHFKSSEITNFNHIVKRVLKHIKEKYSITCIKAGVAAAGRLHKNNIELTNQKWNVKKKDLPFTKVRLMNDFQAMAYGIDVLSKNKILLVKPGTADKGPRVILGAGTGLGKSILLHNGKGYEPLPSEGGHGNFAPMNEDEFKLVKFLQKRLKREVIEWEDVLSGRGLTNIYLYLNSKKFKKTKHTQKIIASGFHSLAICAGRNTDPQSKEVFKYFTRLYARCARNFTLDVLASGGVYIGGGIAANHYAIFRKLGFAKEFLTAHKMKDFLNKVPVYVIKDYNISLYGAAASVE